MAKQWAGSSAFTDAQFNALMSHSRQIEFVRGEEILREGEIGNTFYQVLDGDVEVVKLVQQAQASPSEVKVVLSKGSLFGEAILIEVGEPRSATVRARTDVTVREFDGQGVLVECNRDRDFAAKLYRMLCRVLRGYLGSTTVALAQAKAELKDADARADTNVEDELRRMVAEFKARGAAKDAVPRA